MGVQQHLISFNWLIGYSDIHFKVFFFKTLTYFVCLFLINLQFFVQSGYKVSVRYVAEDISPWLGFSLF